MTSKMIPIQGTFDIAKGRHTLRSYIISEHLPHYFIIRAVTLLTAFGEMVLIVNSGQRIPIYVDITRAECGDVTVRLYCDVASSTVDDRCIHYMEQRLNMTSDNSQVIYHNNHLGIEANLYLSHVALH